MAEFLKSFPEPSSTTTNCNTEEMERVSQNLAGSTLHLLALLAGWMISLVEFFHISKTLPTTSHKIHLHFKETALRCLFPDMATL
jgi:hypothetical protein